MLRQKRNRVFRPVLRILLFFAAISLIAFELYEPKTKVQATVYNVGCPGGSTDLKLNGDTLRSNFDLANNPSAGGITDTINLTPGCIYELDDSPLYPNAGNNGLDSVTNDVAGLDLIINGNGATIRRAADATQSFRILFVNPGAEIVINNVTLANGLGDGNGAGAILNVGSLTINNSTITSNNGFSDGGAFGILGRWCLIPARFPITPAGLAPVFITEQVIPPRLLTVRFPATRPLPRAAQSVIVERLP